MKLQNPDRKYQSSKHLKYCCQYHVVFCPKYRREVLGPTIQKRAEEIFYDVAEDWDFEILDCDILLDHVHLIVSCNPRFGVLSCVHKLKGNTSRILREEFPELQSKLPCLWTRSAFIGSVGAVSLDVVKQYIQNQKDV